MQDYTPALQESHTHPDLYELYLELFDTLANLSDSRELMMHFSFITPAPENDPNNGRYGNFGALQSQFYQFPPYAESPKYRAILDYPCELGTHIEELSLKYTLYPNPNEGSFFIHGENIAADTGISVTDLFGRKQSYSLSKDGKDYRIDVPGALPGIYFVHMRQKEGLEVTKRMVVSR